MLASPVQGYRKERKGTEESNRKVTMFCHILLVRNLLATRQWIDREVYSTGGDPWEPLWSQRGGIVSTFHPDHETEVSFKVDVCYVNMGLTPVWHLRDKKKEQRENKQKTSLKCRAQTRDGQVGGWVK